MEHAEKPPKAFSEFAQAVDSLPADLRSTVTEAIACGTFAMLLSGGLAGELVLRIALPDPRSPAQQEMAATTIGPEMFRLAA